MNVYEKLMNIQVELKSPKSQYNSFGKYKYRNLEDILESLKPLLKEYKVIVNISDEVALVGDRHYIKATARLIDIEKGEEVISTAYAREDESKKGMDLSQLSGSTSSYARKYALNGLFAIDDTKDADTTNTHGKEEKKEYKTNVNSNKQTVSNEKEDNENSNLASQKQLETIYKIAKQKKFEAEAMSSYIKINYEKDSSKQLTKSEASNLIEMLISIE